jgi:hypothetical protein
MTSPSTARSSRTRAPGRPKPGSASHETRLAFVPSMPAQAGTELRHSLPTGDRERYSAREGLS